MAKKPMYFFSKEELLLLRRAHDRGATVKFHSSGEMELIDQSPHGELPSAVKRTTTGYLTVPETVEVLESLQACYRNWTDTMTQYADSVAIHDRRTQDFLHILEEIDKEDSDAVNHIACEMSDAAVERRRYKNEFEMARYIQQSFRSQEGHSSMVYLNKLLSGLQVLQAEQAMRSYQPRSSVGARKEETTQECGMSL